MSASNINKASEEIVAVELVKTFEVVELDEMDLDGVVGGRDINVNCPCINPNCASSFELA